MPFFMVRNRRHLYVTVTTAAIAAFVKKEKYGIDSQADAL